ASRPGAGARVRTVAGAGRPEEGGRGRTCVGRPPRREVIGRIVACGAVHGGAPRAAASCGRILPERCGALYSGPAWRARPAWSRAPRTEGVRAGSRSEAGPPGVGTIGQPDGPSVVWCRPDCPGRAVAACRPCRSAGANHADGPARRVRAAEPPPERVPAFLHDGNAWGDPHPGTALAEGTHPPGHERLALSVARRRPSRAGLRQRRLPDAALQPVRVLRGRADPRVTGRWRR